MKSSQNWGLDSSSSAKIFLAPMEGVVDPVMREMIAEQNSVDVCVTEFVRVTSHLLPEKVFIKYCPELLKDSKTSNNIPVLLQLLGSDPNCIAENAARAAELGAIGIDLNFGCPAKTVNNHDGGASLLKKPERLFHVISAVRNAVPAHISVSAKVRLGFDHKNYVTEIAKMAEDGGASWLTVHARTKTDGYKPPAYWEYIAQMRESISIPVVGNGEIWTVEDYNRCRDVSGCTHIMIGRGLIANPGLGWQIKTGKPQKLWIEWQPFFIEFVNRSLAHRHEQYAVQRAKQMARMMSQTYAEAQLLLEKIKLFQKLGPILDVAANDWPHLDAESKVSSHLIAAVKFRSHPGAAVELPQEFPDVAAKMVREFPDVAAKMVREFPDDAAVTIHSPPEIAPLANS